MQNVSSPSLNIVFKFENAVSSKICIVKQTKETIFRNSINAEYSKFILSKRKTKKKTEVLSKTILFPTGIFYLIVCHLLSVKNQLKIISIVFYSQHDRIKQKIANDTY